MKIKALLFLTLGFYTLIKAQSPCIYIESKGDNVLYIGVDHILTLHGNAGEDSVTASVGKISGNKGHYLLHVNEKPNGPCAVKVWKKGKVIVEREYRFKHVPAPTAYYIGKTSGAKILVSHAKVGPGLSLVLENMDFDFRVAVKEFTLIRIGKDGTREEQKNTGPAFSAESKTILQKIAPGDFLFFKDIVYVLPENTERIATPMIIEITE